MRNFELDEKDPLKVWIHESGAESPSAGFQLNILKKLMRNHKKKLKIIEIIDNSNVNRY